MTGSRRLEDWWRLEHAGTPVWVQPKKPDWFVPNARADVVLRALRDGASVGEAAARYAVSWGLSREAAEAQVLRFMERIPGGEAEPLRPRGERLSLGELKELWLHLTNRCNLACSHCMFTSSPAQGLELDPGEVTRIAGEAAALGCWLFYATGGEPMIHGGYAELCRFVAAEPERHLVTLTNALAVGRAEELLTTLPRDRFHFQVSLDGPQPVHDGLRGAGAFERACRGIGRLTGMGFPVALAMVVDRSSVSHMPWLVKEAARLGVGSVHYLWYFVKGQGDPANVPAVEAVERGLEEAESVAGRLGVGIDNLEIIRSQVLSLPGTRYDLTNSGWQSLAVGPDGQVYPTAALVLEPDLRCGHWTQGLERVWRTAEPLEALRSASVVGTPLEERPLALLVGGGDPDHSYIAGGRFVGADPWLELYERTALRMIVRQAGPEDAVPYPAFRARMGERLEACNEEDAICAFTHSNCVLSLADEDGHTLARSFYAEAAREPNREIQNPAAYEGAEVEALPETAVQRSYGCGSPVLDAGIGLGETVVDLGCGAGLELCIAAERVGREGRVIGIDMLDEMLELARQAAEEVSGKLGYSNIEVRKGLLESLPLADRSVDVVISNCVINLTEDKRRTFEEILRVLRPGGRLVVADVCCDEELPLEIRYNEKLRGECLGGALRQDELIGLLEDVGFSGITVLKRFPYREVRGHRFYSLTYAAMAPGALGTRRAIYRGPFAAVVTEDGRVIPRGRTVELAVSEELPDQSVFLLGDDGAVTNVDLGPGCACFVPPEERPSTTAPRLTEHEGCMVCGARLQYLETSERMVCVYCGRELASSTRCEAGHFVCDECHVGEAPEAIASIATASSERDLLRLFQQVRAHPSIPVHGPEYHALVPAVIVAAARNSGLNLDERHIRTAIDRGRTVAGGACGFMGACGAALGVGAAFSVILGANPYTGDKRRLLHKVTIGILEEIGRLEAARCCQRDSWIALRAAAALSEEVLGVRLEAREELVCEQFRTNRDCLGASCPFWPRRREEHGAGMGMGLPAVSLPVAGPRNGSHGKS